MGQTEQGDSKDQLWERRRDPSGPIDAVDVHEIDVSKRFFELLLLQCSKDHHNNRCDGFLN